MTPHEAYCLKSCHVKWSVMAFGSKFTANCKHSYLITAASAQPNSEEKANWTAYKKLNFDIKSD